jgi:hypothetical protein
MSSIFLFELVFIDVPSLLDVSRKAAPESTFATVPTVNVSKEKDTASAAVRPKGVSRITKATSRTPIPLTEIGSIKRNSIMGTVSIRIKKDVLKCTAADIAKYQATTAT